MHSFMHTLAAVIPDNERQIGVSIQRIAAGRGYLSAMRSIVATATMRRPATDTKSSSPNKSAA